MTCMCTVYNHAEPQLHRMKHIWVCDVGLSNQHYLVMPATAGLPFMKFQSVVLHRHNLTVPVCFVPKILKYCFSVSCAATQRLCVPVPSQEERGEFRPVEQEAQLLLGWPTHGAKLIYLEVKVIELNYRCPMASIISISQEWDATCDFRFHDLDITPWKVIYNDKCLYDLEVTRKGQSGSTVKMHLYLLVNIFVYWHLGPRSNR